MGWKLLRGNYLQPLLLEFQLFFLNCKVFQAYKLSIRWFLICCVVAKVRKLFCGRLLKMSSLLSFHPHQTLNFKFPTKQFIVHARTFVPGSNITKSTPYISYFFAGTWMSCLLPSFLAALLFLLFYFLCTTRVRLSLYIAEVFTWGSPLLQQKLMYYDDFECAVITGGEWQRRLWALQPAVQQGPRIWNWVLSLFWQVEGFM